MEVEVQQFQEAAILCPTCGIAFIPRAGNVCPTCVISRTDITVGITKEAVLNYCRFCTRYLRPPWVNAERESKELLSICLSKIKGLNRVKLVNASFIWTEPHSKRIKVKLTISKNINETTNMEQTFVVEFVEAWMQCDTCKKEFTPHTWGATVQVRQYAEHKKTFYLIEQLILKHNAHDKVLKVEEEEHGINFFYKNSIHAQKLVSFLTATFPTNVVQSKQLISHDESSNIFNYKYGFMVEIPKICRDDLIIIPKKFAKELGGVSEILLCLKVGQSLQFIDLASGKYIHMNHKQYFHYEKDIDLLPLKRYKSTFQVLDFTPTPKTDSKRTLHDVVLSSEKFDLIETKTHFSHLNIGYDVDCFDLRNINYTQELNEVRGLPEVIIVRKVKDVEYKRLLKLKRLRTEGVMVEEKKKRKNEEEEDLDEFIDEVIDDDDLKKDVNVFVSKEDVEKLGKEQQQKMMEDMQLCLMFDEMSLGQPEPNDYKNEQDKEIDELVSRMDKVTIEKE